MTDQEIAPGHAKSAGIVGILIIIFAFIDVVLGIVWASYGGGDAQGIWCGLLLAITGLEGIMTWWKKSKCWMISFMVCCIIDIICCIVATIIAGIAFLIWQLLKAVIETKCTIKNDHCDCGNESIPMELEDCSWISTIEAIFLCLLIINGLCTIVVFTGSIIGCVATCCASSPQQSGVVVVQNPNTQGAVIIHTTASSYPPQQGAYPPQQGAYPPQQGGYPPQQGGYPPQQGGYPAQGAPPPVYSNDTAPPGQYPMADPIPPKVD